MTSIIIFNRMSSPASDCTLPCDVEPEGDTPEAMDAAFSGDLEEAVEYLNALFAQYEERASNMGGDFILADIIGPFREQASDVMGLALQQIENGKQ